MYELLKDFLFWLSHPGYWVMNNPYSPEWDRMLSALMKAHSFDQIDEYTACLGGKKIWITNRPYASMCPRHIEVRPKRRTIHKAHIKLVADQLKAL